MDEGLIPLDILMAANKGYGDDSIRHFYDAEGEFVEDPAYDGLARFIACNLCEIVECHKSDPIFDAKKAIEEAAAMLYSAKHDLDLIINALSDMRLGFLSPDEFRHGFDDE